jgi:hypothetical protein
MAVKEIVILITVAAAMAAFGMRARQAGILHSRVVSATLAFGCGLFTVLLMMVGDSVLAQVLLLVPGVICVGESAGVSRGIAAARRRSAIAAGVTLALSLPLAGIGAATLLLTGLSGWAVAAIAAMERAQRRVVIEMPAQQPALPNRQVEYVAGAAA